MFKTTCRNVLQLIDAYLDGELSSGMTAEVDAHLLQCPECQRQFELMRATGHAIAHDQSEPALPEDFADHVMAQLSQFDKLKLAQPDSEESNEQEREPEPVQIIESHVVAPPTPWLRRAVMGLPAVAAVLFLSAIFWPQPVQDEQSPGMVLGQSHTAQDNGESAVALPLVSGAEQETQQLQTAMKNVQQAPLILQQALQMVIGEVQRDMQTEFATDTQLLDDNLANTENDQAAPEWSVMDVLFPPLSELIAPTPVVDASDEQTIERF